MVRKSRLRRDRYETLKKIDVECGLGSSCVWPHCTCPAREGRAASTNEGAVIRGKRVYKTPAGPYIKRRVRPKGWTPLSDWVVVRTKTGQENWAALNCKQQAIETWIPRYMQPGSGIPKALFPGYMFARPEHRWQKLSNTYGVVGIIMRGGEPEYVPKVVMKTLRANADKDGIVTLPRQRKPEKGEAVEIKVGAWQGFTGLYDGLDPEGRRPAADHDTARRSPWRRARLDPHGRGVIGAHVRGAG